MTDDELQLFRTLFDKREEHAYTEVRAEQEKSLIERAKHGDTGSSFVNPLRTRIALRRLYVLERTNILDVVTQVLAQSNRKWTDDLASAVFGYAEARVKGILGTFMDEYQCQFRMMGCTPSAPDEAYRMATDETKKFLSTIRRDLNIQVSMAKLAKETEKQHRINDPTKLFISYAHQNTTELTALEAHLSVLIREGLIDVWYDRKITAGTELNPEISKHLDSADIILLLVSKDFLNSNYCCEIETTRAMERHEADKARVIPIIMRHCEWRKASFSKLKLVPRDGQPVYSQHWNDPDEAFLDVITEIRRVVEELREQELQDGDDVDRNVNSRGISVSFGLTQSVRFRDGLTSQRSPMYPAVFIENHSAEVFTIRRVNLYCQTGSGPTDATEHRLQLTPNAENPLRPCKPINREDTNEWKRTFAFFFIGTEHMQDAAQTVAEAPTDTLRLEVWADEDEGSPIVQLGGKDVARFQSLVAGHMQRMQSIADRNT